MLTEQFRDCPARIMAVGSSYARNATRNGTFHGIASARKDRLTSVVTNAPLLAVFLADVHLMRISVFLTIIAALIVAAAIDLDFVHRLLCRFQAI